MWTNLKRRLLSLRGSTLSLAASPLWLAAIIGLFQGRLFKTVATLSAALCLTTAARLTRKTFKAIAAERAEPDQRQTALWLTTLGIGILSTYLLRRPPFILGASILAALSYYYHYIASSPSLTTPEPPPSTEHLSPALADILTQAEQATQTLALMANKPELAPFTPQIHRIINHSRELIRACAPDEHRIRQARPLLLIILPELASITSQTQASHHDALKPLLDSSEQILIEQLDNLTQDNHLTLDIKMDALRRQLDHTREL